MDLVHDCLPNGRPYKMLTVLDEFTRRTLDEYSREALSVSVATRMGSQEVLEALTPLILQRGAPDCLRSENGPVTRPL